VHFSDLLVVLIRPFIAAGTSSPFPALLIAVLTALIVPTGLMGAAFPLTVRLYEMSASKGEARAVGQVYLANTIGSITGSLLAGFFLIRAIGSQNGLFVMCCVNLGLGAWFLWRRRKITIAIAAIIVAAAFALAKPNQVILSAGIFDSSEPILLFARM